MEELKEALAQYNMSDEQKIEEIISEVDIDHVSIIKLQFLLLYCLEA